jgi:hypothetical protein
MERRADDSAAEFSPGCVPFAGGKIEFMTLSTLECGSRPGGAAQLYSVAAALAALHGCPLIVPGRRWLRDG